LILNLRQNAYLAQSSRVSTFAQTARSGERRFDDQEGANKLDNHNKSSAPLPFKCSAVVSDVDGTLVTDDKNLTALARAAVAGLRASGIVFSMISSRPPRGLHMLLEPLAITTPVGGFNGGVIATPDLAVVSEHLLSPQVARRAVDRLSARGIQVWVFSGQDWLVRDPDGLYVALEERTVGFRPTIVEDFGSALEAAAKIVGVSRNFDVLEQCERNMRTALDDGAFVARSQPYYLDITHPLANKGEALSEIATLLGVPLAEIAVIGDGGNDVAMFERGGLSIAMGNASPEVQRKADFVTDSNSEDGFARAIERFIFSDGRSRPRVEVAKAGDRAW
jgi:Cof subfamily protein (haloacid dehalogenase superfamily)